MSFNKELLDIIKSVKSYIECEMESGVYEYMSPEEKGRVYNYIARLVLDKIPFEKALDRVDIVIDRSKNKREIAEFNRYIISQLSGEFDPTKVPLNIEHPHSHEHAGLQIADLFSWGIFRKYEKKNTEWYDVFKEKIRFDELFLGG